MQTISRDYFDVLYEQSTDPWHITDSWYEQRKRSLVTAILPRRRFRKVLEPGCGTGELSVELGQRCEQLWAGDFSDAAVGITRERWQQAMLSQHMDCVAHFSFISVPQQWPEYLGAVFDLIVISEFAYYLDDASLQALPALITASLAPDGIALACHWKHAFEERTQTTQAVHAVIHDVADLHHCARYEDADFLLDVWSRKVQSVAELEGLR
jgi:SAM-dependent methyltransferase